MLVDRAVYAELLANALRGVEGLRVEAVAPDAASLVADTDAELDVVVVDVASPGGSLADVAKVLKARWPIVALVVCADANDRATLLAARNANVSALVDRAADLAGLVERIRATDGSITVVSPAALAQARAQLRSTAPRSPVAGYPRLTEREREVLEGISRGQSPAAIAASLRISVNTCRGYLRTLMAKLGARTQLEVASFVAEHGLPPETS